MPSVEELLNQQPWIETLDLTKRYWLIPLMPMSREKTAFTTLFGLHQFVTLPFGLFVAPATFQCLLDRVLQPNQAYAAAYLDNIIIYSNDWRLHMKHLGVVLRSLCMAGLTANQKKCAIGRVEVWYLGFHLGHRQVQSQIDKTAAIVTCPCPKIKKEVRPFLQAITGVLCLAIWTSPVPGPTSLKRGLQIRSSGWSSANRLLPR